MAKRIKVESELSVKVRRRKELEERLSCLGNSIICLQEIRAEVVKERNKLYEVCPECFKEKRN